jgi:LysM repeat protein
MFCVKGGNNMKNKYMLGILLGAIIGSIILIMLINAPVAKGSTNMPDYITVTVEKGDTLWGIVKNNCKGYKDIRKVVYDIKKINNIKSASISPGQKIKIPSEYKIQ